MEEGTSVNRDHGLWYELNEASQSTAGRSGLDRGPPGKAQGRITDQEGVQLWAEQINPISTYAWKPMLPFGSSAAWIVPNLASYFLTLSSKALIILFI